VFQTLRSESPSQVFVILIQWLLSLTQYNGRTPDVKLAYDNMCNLDRLKASCSPVPLQSPLDQLWINVNKVIDVFHFSNHIRPLCRQKYSPEAVKRAHPNWNTQAGEQTFVWLSRFKHSVCSMPKFDHLFYIHCIVIRRNTYTLLQVREKASLT